MKQSFITILLTMLMSMTGAKAFAHDIEVANNDGVTIYYVWANNNTELAVSCRGSYYNSYNYEYTGNVVIPESVDYYGNTYPVTSIGSQAFRACSGLTSVTIPTSVISIGDEAFQNCDYLTYVTIPHSVTSIGNSAFYQCSGLTSVTIPNNVTSIGFQAFCFCSGLTSVTIPNSVTSIGDEAFKYSGLSTIVSEIKSPFGIGSIASSSATLVVPVGTKAAYQSITGWSSFTKIIEVGEGGFVGDIFENDDIHYAIGENNTASLTSANKIISGEFVIPSQVELNGKKYDVTSIGSSALIFCSGLTSVTIPNSVTSIGYKAFSSCTGLTSVTIPSSVISIGDEAFYYCSGLTSIAIPNSVTSIGNSAFYECSGLTSVTIPNSVTSIGQAAFSGCSGLTSVIIGSGVLSIGSSAFYNTNLKKTIWLTNTPPSGYNNAAGAVNYVSNDQFSFYNQLTYKYQFLSSYFDINGIRYVPISPSERTCDAIDCVYDESAANTKIASTVEYKGVTMTVKNIKPYLAYNNKFIKTLTVDNDGELADYAFTDCSNLETVTHGENINRIGKGTFSGCSSLTSLTTSEKTTLSNVLCISKNVTTIDNYAFMGCSAIKNIIFMDSDAELKLGANLIGDRYYEYPGTPLFSDCPLDSVYIGRNIDYNSTKQYGYSPFYSNTSLRAVKITDKETEISENEFYGCTNLQQVKIGDGVTTIGNWSFSGCSSLKYFAFGSQLTTIGQNAFSDCAALIEISSKAKTPPECGNQALDDINKWECRLFVPEGCYDIYKSADQWKEFFFIEEGESSINDISSYKEMDIQIQCNGSLLTIIGANVGTTIRVFDIEGRPIGSLKASTETTTINTSLRSGDIGIVKIGEKAIKVLMK